MSNDPASPYAAPNTPIASAKRPRTKKDMHSPSAIRTTSRIDLKHKSKLPNKALFTSPQGTAATAGDGTSNLGVANDAVTNVTVNSVYTSSSLYTTENSSLTSTPKKSTASLDWHSPSAAKVKAEAVDKEVNVSAEATCEEIAQKAEDEMAAAHEQEQEADESVFNPYLFMAELPPLDSIERNNVLLPPKERDMEGKPTLVLDLDETLVHCTVEAIDKPDLTFPVMFNGVLYDVYVRKRPYLDYFLEVVSRSFEVVVFTASQKVYADVLLDLLDPEKKFIKHRLFREACVFVNGNYLKDLHVCGREYHQMALVDNSPHAYSYQIENGIPIESWFDDDTDTELLKLVGFLRRCFSEGDVRPIIENKFKTHELIVRASKGLHVDLSAPAL